MKFHTIFSITLAVILLVVIILRPSWLLVACCLLLIAYVTGNGVIHAKKSQLTRDGLLEYVLVALIALAIIAGAVVK